MRLFCINDRGWVKEKKYLFGAFKREVTTDGPEYGDVVTVVGSEYGEGKLWYFLMEWPGGEPFNAECFIPLSEIDEMSFNRAQKEELA